MLVQAFASFHRHLWIQTGIIVRKCPILLKIGYYWRITLKNNRAPLLCYFKFCAPLDSHQWNITGVTARKRLYWVLTSVTLVFDIWPWPFAGTLQLSLAITPGNLMVTRWWEHSEDGVTDGQTSCLVEAKIHHLKCTLLNCVSNNF